MFVTYLRDKTFLWTHDGRAVIAADYNNMVENNVILSYLAKKRGRTPTDFFVILKLLQANNFKSSKQEKK